MELKLLVLVLVATVNCYPVPPQCVPNLPCGDCVGREGCVYEWKKGDDGRCVGRNHGMNSYVVRKRSHCQHLTKAMETKVLIDDDVVTTPLPTTQVHSVVKGSPDQDTAIQKLEVYVTNAIEDSVTLPTTAITSILATVAPTWICPVEKESLIEQLERSACRHVKLYHRAIGKKIIFTTGAYDYVREMRVNPNRCKFLVWRRHECN